MIRALLVDDQLLVREGLRRILRSADDLDVVAECSDGDEVEAAVMEAEPDVVVMDVRMKRVDGAEATRRLKQMRADLPVLVLTTYDDDEVVSAALRAGANGFQLKDAPGEDLIKAVRTVAQGGAWLDPAVTERVLATYRQAAGSSPSPSAGPSPLTPREEEVLTQVARGLSNAEVAEALYISEVTVKTHLGRVLYKLGLRDRAAAIVWAFDHGLVDPHRAG